MQKETIIHNNRKVTKTTKTTVQSATLKEVFILGLMLRLVKKSPHPSPPKLYEVLTEKSCRLD